MPRAEANKLYRTFNKGLITESTTLTSTEDATVAEDNCVIWRKGKRSRRLGIKTTSDLSTQEFNPSAGLDAVQEYRWEAAGNVAERTFLVAQFGRYVSFFDLAQDNDPDFMAGKLATEIDLDDYIAVDYDAAWGVPSEHPCSFASGKGYLFIAHKCCDPILVEWSEDDEDVTATTILVLERDFDGIDDELSNSEEPTTLSDEHKYNLKNQGWFNATNDGTGDTVTNYDWFGRPVSLIEPSMKPATDYFTAETKYPSNAKQWWQAKDATTGAFDPDIYKNLYAGESRAPRGHYIFESFRKSREDAAGIEGLPGDPVGERPNAIAFYAGRVWYGLNSTVYFSQIMQDKRQAGMCFQEADPTSEDLADLLPTDGGVIPIPEASQIQALRPFGDGVMVFAANGIWHVSGTSAGFTALDLSVSKVSSVGMYSPGSVVQAQDKLFWWGRDGIIVASQSTSAYGAIPGKFEITNTTETTIQRFYMYDIPDDCKPFVKGVYDTSRNVIQWLFQSKNIPQPYIYNRVLNLQLSNGAYYPWTTSLGVGDGLYFMCGIFLADRVIDTNITERNPLVRHLCAMFNGATWQYCFGAFISPSFTDWKDQDDAGVGAKYTSFALTNWEILDDAMRKKTASYLYVYFNKTERYWRSMA